MEASGRVGKLEYNMGFAIQAAKRGTCSRLQVGAVVVKNDIIMTTAYNGVPKGEPHCDHVLDSHSSCTKAVHAEMNAIVFAGRDKCQGGQLFITHAPCLACSGPIIQSGIECIWYLKDYKNLDGVMRLKDRGILINQLVHP